MSALPGLGGFGESVVGKAVYELAGDLSRLRSDLAQGMKEAEGTAARMEAAQKARASRFMAIGGAMVAVFGTLAIKGAHDAAEWGGEVRILTRELGVSAESASKLAYAGHHLGIETEVLSKSFGIFSKHLAANDKAVEKYGISLKDANGKTKSFDQVLGETAELFKNTPNGVQKTAMALELFGRGGKALTPLLSQGREGLKELGNEAKRFGLVISGEQLDNLKRFKFAQRDLGAEFKGLSVQLGNEVIPFFTGLFHVIGMGVELFLKIPAPVRSAGLAVFGLVGLSLLLHGAWLRLQVAGVTFSNTLIGRLLTGLRATTVATEAQTVALEGEAAAAEAAGAASAGAAAGMGAILGPLALLAGGLALIFSWFHRTNEEAKSAAQQMAQSFTPGARGAEQMAAAIKKLNAQQKEEERISDRLIRQALVTSVEDKKSYDSLQRQISQHNKLAKKYGDTAKELKKLQEEQAAEAVSEGQAADKIQRTFETTAQLNSELAALVARGLPKQLADDLRGMGDDGAAAVHHLMSASKEDLDQFVGAWKSTQTKVKTILGMSEGDFQNWRQQTIDNLNPVKGMIGDLGSKTKVTLADMTKDLKSHIDGIVNYRKNWQTVQQMNLPETVKTQLLKELPPDLLNTFVKGTKKDQDKFIAQIERAFGAGATSIGDFNGELGRLQDLLGGLGSSGVGVNVKVTGHGTGRLKLYQTGGWIEGYGPKPIIAHGGEYVIRPEASRALGRQVLDMLNQGKLPVAATSAPAGGGSVHNEHHYQIVVPETRATARELIREIEWARLTTGRG